MDKVQFSGTVITLDIFRCSVLVLVGKDEESIIKGLPDLFKENEWEDVDKSIDLIRKSHCEEDDFGVYKGKTLPNGVDALVIFLANTIADVSEETALHELGHAMRYILRVHGVDDEETEMYTHEYLFHEFLCAQDAFNEDKTNTFVIEEK